MLDLTCFKAGGGLLVTGSVIRLRPCAWCSEHLIDGDWFYICFNFMDVLPRKIETSDASRHDFMHKSQYILVKVMHQVGFFFGHYLHNSTDHFYSEHFVVSGFSSVVRVE